MSEITIKQYRQLREDIDEAKTAAERARGALDQTIETLKKDFKVKNLKEAKDKLTELQALDTAAHQKFSKAFKAYEKKWKEE